MAAKHRRILKLKVRARMMPAMAEQRDIVISPDAYPIQKAEAHFFHQGHKWQFNVIRS
jgi:hypothetical protein